MNKNEIMKLCVESCIDGMKNHEGGPFGCAIVKDGEVIAVAHNTVIKTNDPTAHGEVNAIREACKKLNTFDLSGCELYTTSEPCPMCMSAIIWANISKVYYGCTVDSVFNESYPVFDEKALVKDEVEIAIQVNGKIKNKIMVASSLDEEGIKSASLADEKIKASIGDKTVVKVIVIKGRLVNIVVK